MLSDNIIDFKKLNTLGKCGNVQETEGSKRKTRKIAENKMQ